MPRAKRERSKQKHAFPSAEQENATIDREGDAVIDPALGVEIPSGKTTKSIVSTSEKFEAFEPQQVEFLFDVWIGALCFVFSMLLKVEWKILFDSLKWDEHQKEVLSKPLCRIINKHAPKEWRFWTDEIELGMALIMNAGMSFGEARRIAAAEYEKRVEKAKRANAENANGTTRNTVTEAQQVPV